MSCAPFVGLTASPNIVPCLAPGNGLISTHVDGGVATACTAVGVEASA